MKSHSFRSKTVAQTKVQTTATKHREHHRDEQHTNNLLDNTAARSSCDELRGWGSSAGVLCCLVWISNRREDQDRRKQPGDPIATCQVCGWPMKTPKTSQNSCCVLLCAVMIRFFTTFYHGSVPIWTPTHHYCVKKVGDRNETCCSMSYSEDKTIEGPFLGPVSLPQSKKCNTNQSTAWYHMKH